MTHPFGETVTRLRGTHVDDGHGGTYVDWTNPTSLEIVGVALAPRSEGEAHDPGRAGVIVGFTLYAPFGSDIDFEDRLQTSYGLFELEGRPGPWKNPFTGTEAGVTAALRRVEG